MKISPSHIIWALLFVLCSAQDNTGTFRNRYIITAESDTLPLELTARMDSLEAEFTLTLDEVGVAVVTSTHPEFAAELSKIDGIGSVTDDFEVQLIDPIDSEEETIQYTDPPFSNDSNPYFNLQWGLNAIHAVEAWNIGSRGDGVLVAVLDSGFDLDHPDLRPNIDLNKSINLVPNQTLQANGTRFSHGSHVSGIIAAADNDIGIIGVAPEAKLMLVKVLRYNGRGRFSWIFEGIRHAVNEGADIINMSFGAHVSLNSSIVEAYRRVTTYAHNKGVTLIAAGGNGGQNLTANKTHIYLPGGSPYVLAMAATSPIGWVQYPQKTSLDNIARYSNYGDTVIDFAAPGGDNRFAGTGNATIGNITRAISVFDLVISTTSNSGWTWAGGTSMAVPHAAGVVALIISNNGGSMSPDEVKRVLDASADDLGKPGCDDFFGCGRLNAYRAVKCLQEDNSGLKSLGKF